VDNVRNAVVLSLILFHTARLFDHQLWHIKDVNNYVAADILVGTFDLYSMPVLFLLAGYSAMLSLRRRSAGRFAAERLTRLLVPFVVGIFLLVLPQVYFERIAPVVPATQSPLRLDVGFLAFVPRFFDCCYDHGNFSWHHLWFLIYLFLYSLVLLPVLLVLDGRFGTPVRRGFDRLAGSLAGLYLLALPFVFVVFVLAPRFPSNHALAGDWANHANFLYLMVLGALVSRSEAPLAAMKRGLPALATIGGVLYALAIVQTLGSPFMPGPVWAVVRVGLGWSLILAVIAAFARFDRRIAWLTGFSRYSMAFYMVHQTIIIAFGFLTIGWSEAPLLKYVVIAAASAVLSLALAWAIDQTAATRFLFGMGGKKRPAVA
jgi:membrane-bound acyltransferase YfiQ involved in biofilm formation